MGDNITTLTKNFIFTFASLLTMIVIIFSSSSIISKKNDKKLAFARITSTAGLSLGVSYFEPRVREYSNDITFLYPNMQKINNMDFIYEP